tara:strand:+ start:15045 stop:16787 length:1743 start_codon:yes stop_codon:yes gene_type:complete
MSLLPTAHAGQSFGSRRIDFFTVSGEVSNSDAGTGRVRDGDGVEHEIRLIERSSAFAKGDTATVLRVQSGPNRRSRPVAIINHSRELWMRAAPDATNILARSGVTRTLNWWLSVLALALLAIAVAWPSLHGFLTEVNGAMMAGLPAFDIYAELGAPLPGLASWRLETALSPGLFDGISALGFVPMEQLTEWGLGLAVAALSLVAFFARSWRLVYVPALAILCVFAGAILGNPVVSLAMIGGAVLLFIIGGFVNRIRDAGRFNARVERLAEYVLRHPPEEGVRTFEAAPAEPVAPEPLAAAAAATAIAAASAVAQGDEPDHAEAVAEHVTEEIVEPETIAAATIAAADEPVLNEETPVENAPADPAESSANGEVAAEAASEGEADTDAPAPTGAQEVQADVDDDLPSLEAVAAAAALNDIERTSPAENAVAPVTLDDDRTMAVAAPPPMPPAPAPIETAPVVLAAPEPDAPAAPSVVEPDEPTTLAPEPEAVPALEPVDEPVSERTDEVVEAAAAPDDSQDEPAPETVALVEETVAEAPEAPTAAIDDPMIDDDHDPMVQSASGDFAPGAPDIEEDREPAE